MGKITPPPVPVKVGVNVHDAIVTIEQMRQMLPKPEPTELKAMICPCCGAPLHGDTCEYCGVDYY